MTLVVEVKGKGGVRGAAVKDVILRCMYAPIVAEQIKKKCQGVTLENRVGCELITNTLSRLSKSISTCIHTLANNATLNESKNSAGSQGQIDRCTTM